MVVAFYRLAGYGYPPPMHGAPPPGAYYPPPGHGMPPAPHGGAYPPPGGYYPPPHGVAGELWLIEGGGQGTGSTGGSHFQPHIPHT